LILNEFKQIAFSALIGNDRMLIMNAANNCMVSRRHVPSIIRLCHAVRTQGVYTYCTWRPLPDGTPTHIRVYTLYF